MKAIAVAALSGALLFSVNAAAHDFWIQPDRFDVDGGAPLAWTVLAGHGADRQRSEIPHSRITRFDLIGPDGQTTDLRQQLAATEKGGEGRFQATRPGTYMMVMATDHGATSRLPARMFNDYLKLEGLTPAITSRAREGAADRDGSERYGRVAKSIVRVGPFDAGAARHVTEPAGLSLEIVPDRDPVALAPGERLPIRVFYQGKPLQGALVKLTNLADDAKPVAMRRTNHGGAARFDVPSEGDWMLNIVWTRRLSEGEDVDFETLFSSLSFRR